MSSQAHYMNDLKKGDKVEVFNFVNRKSIVEGVATLGELEVYDGSRQLWTVRFADGDIAERWVYECDLVGGN